MINLLIERLYLKEDYTIGRLTVDGVPFCDTLEDPVRDFNKDGDLNDSGEEKIYGFTAIPFGRYRVIIKRSPKFKRDLPRILDVNNFTDILIHAGNTSKDSAGCVLVGENKIKGKLVNSRLWETKLVERLKHFLNYEHDIWINVT